MNSAPAEHSYSLLDSPPARKILLSLACVVMVCMVFTAGYHARIERGSYRVVPNQVELPRGFDLRLRYDEMQCVRAGVNPFDVWNETRTFKDYYRYDHEPSPHSAEPLHAYAPWVYTYFYPLACLSWPVASGIFYALQILALFVIAGFAFHFGYQRAHRLDEGFVCMAAAFFVGIPYENSLFIGNFGLLAAAFICLMIYFLNQGRDVLAGICWALIMTKPQLGVLFFIPLLFQKKFLTIGTAVFICVVASLWPAWLCKTSPISMVLCLGEAGAPYCHSTMLIPGPIFAWCSRFFGSSITGIISAVIGISLCCLLSWRVRRAHRWERIIFPALLFSTAWSYCHTYDRCLWGILQILFMSVLLGTQNTRARYPLIVLLLLFSHEIILVVQPIFYFSWVRRLSGFTATGWFHLLLSGLFFLLPFIAIFSGMIWCWRQAPMFQPKNGS